MEPWKAVILGILQGVTEFLPVSSSGHLVVAQRLLGLESGRLFFFDVVLHLGTLFALTVALRKEVVNLVRNWKEPVHRHILYLTLVSTMVTGVVYFIFKKVLMTGFEGGWLVAVGFFVTALLLATGEYRNPSSTGEVFHLSFPGAFWIGLLQGAAILPGLSRSGATIAGGMMMGLRRESAVFFSLLLLFPAILGGLVAGALEPPFHTAVSFEILALGFFSAVVSGVFAVRLLLYLSGRTRFYGFSVYCIVLGILTGVMGR